MTAVPLHQQSQRLTDSPHPCAQPFILIQRANDAAWSARWSRFSLDVDSGLKSDGVRISSRYGQQTHH